METANGLKLPPNNHVANDRDSNYHSHDQQHGKSSCHSVGHNEDPFAKITDPISCRLTQYDEGNMVDVAVGQVYPTVEGRLVHGIPLSPQNVHVSIDSVIEPNAPLPVPVSGYNRVGEMEGSFVQWPKVLVKMLSEGKMDGGPLNDNAYGKSKDKESCNKDMDKDGNGNRSVSNDVAGINKTKKQVDGTMMKKKRKTKDTGGNKAICELTKSNYEQNHNKKEPTKDANNTTMVSMKDSSELGPNCKALEKFLLSLAMQEHNVITTRVDQAVYNYAATTDVHLSCDDIKQMFAYECLNISILQLWGSFLYHNEPSYDETNIAYMCPQQLCSFTNNPLDMEMYVVNTLKKEKKYAMGAYFQDKHWMLVVLCAEEKLAYIFESGKAQDGNKLKIVEHLKGAWKVYGVVGGGRYTIGKKNELKCPSQPADYVCGYYVMKWMYDITLHYSSMTVDKFEKCVSELRVTTEDMDQVRELWAKNFMDNI